ncbi:hypothetical protein [Rhodopila globiformis]|uniref:Uncharacterized protein n=1 Tax=Rhodopila globiformis TaxID=1071 RepID=A0A2S6MW61_RHOGL|nr:hypothetical protein [Rhodopila globiformis]PPQ26603.1 hypothetical protein CCS01_30070 [Rhodopila globiformis]
MDKPERLHRPELDRDEPRRDFMSYIRTHGLGGEKTAAAPEQDDGAPIEATVAHGVKLGYSVIDEQIRQGEKLAARLRQVSGKPGAMPPAELSTLIERALNIYKDMGALAVAAMETLVRSPLLQPGVTRAWQASPDAAAATTTGGATNFRFELAANRRTQVRLDIRPQGATFMPLVHSLHAATPSAPPLTAVRFHLDPATASPVLHLDVPDGQPAGVYSGVVVDSATNEPCGTLSVRIMS